MFLSVVSYLIFCGYYQIESKLSFNEGDGVVFRLFLLNFGSAIVSPLLFLLNEAISERILDIRSKIYGWPHILFIFLTGYYTWLFLFPRLCSSFAKRILNMYMRIKSYF